VTSCNEAGVGIGTERIETRTIMWAAGVKASPAAAWLGVSPDRAGRVKVEADLSVPEHPDVFVLGDTALQLDADGKPLPGVAPVAKQQGEYLAKALVARLHGKAVPPFRYRNFGSLATIGRKHAVADFGKVHLSGFIAWVLWSAAHVYFLIGFRRRLIVALHWAWSYITYQRGTRLITGLTGSRRKDATGDDRESGTHMRGAA
jgi:NADH dehydrogenase